MPWVKCYLRGVLEKAHNGIPRGPGDLPHVRVPIRSYVDDITQYMHGTAEYICRYLPQAAASFQHDIAELGCFLSSKSVAVASAVELQRLLEDEFRRHGLYSVRAHCQGSRLGHHRPQEEGHVEDPAA
eukprot:3508366-Pyramimonas_sp.AAC.1